MNFLEITISRIILKTYLYLETTGRPNSFERFPYLRTLTERLTEESLDAWQHDTGTEAARYSELLCRICGNDLEPDNSILYNTVDLCLAAAHVPEFSAYLNYYTGNLVTLQLAAELNGITYSNYDDLLCRLQKLQKICFVDWSRAPLSLAAVTADHALFSHLAGTDTLSPKLFSGQIEYFGHDSALYPLFIRQALAIQGAAWIADSAGSQTSILHIRGNEGCRFLSKHIAHQLKRTLILVDVPKNRHYLEADTPDSRFWYELLHAAYIKNALVCLHNITAAFFLQTQTTPSDLMAAVLPLAESGIPVILCTDLPVQFSSDAYTDPPLRQITLHEMTRRERETAFHGFSELYQLPIDCAQYSVRYPLSVSQIADAVMRWRFTDHARPELFADICHDILYKEQDNILGQLLYPSVRFADLELPLHTKKTLEQICCSASEGYRIFEEWDLSRQYPYGRAVTVLLYGPPGTGKTMTAHAIAKELGTPLYHVDLSHVLDKYIGETEKHLEQIFAFAQKTRPVLFFDEADSLFGRRGEVTDGKDRYANMEVSYILQRIEQFDGIVVLATNLYNSIDKAFLRRMKYVLKYQSPDAAMRYSIWENCLPPGLPCEKLDLDYLAARFDFTGGIIKNVIYTACVIAVHEQKKLCMEHLLNAIRAEYEKLGLPVTKDTWGEYGALLEGVF